MYSTIYLSIFLFLGSICVASPNPAPAPSPTRFLEPRATTCNADNCYRAAKSLNENYQGGYYNSILPLCSSFTSPTTVVTSLTSSPLTLPSSCSAPRITSLCDCLAPAQPCQTRAATQRVQNPSFEDGTTGGGAGDSTSSWSFSDTANNFALYNNNMQDYQGTWGLTIWADGLSGVFTASQLVYLCPGYQYAFSAYVGYAYFFGPPTGPVFNSNVTVYFNDQVIVPTQPACTSVTQCNKPTPQKPQGFEAGFRQITGTAPITAADASGTLKIVITRDVSGNTNDAYGYDVTAETLLDLITLTRVG